MVTPFDSAWLVLKAPFVYEPNPSEGSWKKEFDTGEIDYLFRGQKVGDEQGRVWTPNIKEAIFHSLYGDSTGREGTPELLIARSPDKDIPLMRDPTYGDRNLPQSLVNLQGKFDDVQSLQGWDIHEFLSRSPGMRSIRRAFPDMFEQPEGYVPPDDLPSFASVEHPFFEEQRNRRLTGPLHDGSIRSRYARGHAQDRIVMDLFNAGYGKELSQLAGILRDGYTEMNTPDFEEEPYDEDAYFFRIMGELAHLAEKAGVPAPISLFAR